MRWTLPSAIVMVFACHRHEAPPVAPGPPIPAEREVQVDTLQKECDALLAQLATWRTCPNLDDYGRRDLDVLAEYAKQTFDADAKLEIEPRSAHAIALSCRRATSSARAATERCNAGKPPPRNY